MRNDDIRPATPDDAAACAGVLTEWMNRTAWMPRELPPARLEALIVEAFPHREIWVVGDPVDGYMSVDPAADKIGALYCLRTGQGIGKRFLDKAKAGRDHLWLTTHEPNLAAQRFYRREGFVETGRLPPEPPETLPVIRMEWRA